MKVPHLMACAVAAAALSACASMMHHQEAPVDVTACNEHGFNVYFDDAQADLTPEAREAIAAQGRMLRGCQIQHVRIVGLADAPGDPNENLQISQQRAETVARFLRRHTNWPQSSFELVARGEQNATNDEGEVRPMRRRARVTVTAAPPAAASP